MSMQQGRSHLTPGARLWRNRQFNIFWFGQTLSVLGDSFAVIAIPLLVLQATGSVATMGLVTGVFGVGQVVMGIFAGLLVDRLDRRKLMIFSDLARTLLYLTIPICWYVYGPQLWLIFVVVALGSCLGMTFQITYVTTIANLVDTDQITEANGRMQVTYAIAFVLGPVLAGAVSGSFGSSVAISFDALSFFVSAFSIFFIRLKPQQTLPPVSMKGNVRQEFLAGLQFLWKQPVLRWVTILLFFLTILTSGAMDLFMFHLKHDLKQSDSVVGIVFGLASLGSLAAGLMIPTLRKRLGFGFCWIAGFMLNCLFLGLIGVSGQLSLIALMAVGFTFTSTMAGVTSMSLRQEITPDHLLGRVTSAFWTITAAPGPLGAAFFTALTEKLGTPMVSLIIGGVGMLVVGIAIFTPIRQKYPERAANRLLALEADQPLEILPGEPQSALPMVSNEIFLTTTGKQRAIKVGTKDL
ncbi:MFS transporter [Tengunoibacter tsumagoiensis]|uniref:MFS transporter n=1 Tax=Tengunoibacter tsumagoiensis TaxID=2014871 RepID=A0A402A4C3_9CHLR|nr:MFS transporter [Tengunoibacter tsumagoiensis]GCE13970.1 MFS transporter [Tengunoibacter tsumagoiensis]